MKKILRSFAIGASLNQGKFAALILKFRFDDRSEALTAWPKPQMMVLVKMLLEYRTHLHQSAAHLDPDSLESEVRGDAPKLLLEEIECLPFQAVVEVVTARVPKENTLDISIKRVRQENADIFVLQPNQCPWLLGFILNTLDEFADNDEFTTPRGMSH